jgi:ABC-type multidrug transport system permease subunit
MFNLQTCYSLSDIILSVALFILLLTVISAFTALMTHLILGAIQEVKGMNKQS